jgi:lambda family phage portal protein
MPAPNSLDRFILALSPTWGLRRIRARAAASYMFKHYEAASRGRRTAGWKGTHADANVAAGSALGWLRAHSRDLVRNNAWATNGVGVISDNTVGWGIIPKALGEARVAANAAAAWQDWADTTACDADGRLTFTGLQALGMRSVVESGEVLIRRRWRRPQDGIPLNMQIQLLESDFIDTSKDGTKGQEGGPIVQGIEFDAIGRRVAYWLFEEHPGSNRSGLSSVSRRVSASDIIHVYRIDRPGQVRGVPWLATAIVGLKDFDEFEDAQLMRQKIAACFAVFVTDFDGNGDPLLGPDGKPLPQDPMAEELAPGMIVRNPPGKDVKFANPPLVTDDGFSTRTLRKIAAGIRSTYEDLTGDYSQVNFSSARMARLKHWAAVYGWRYNMLVPHTCDGVWSWAMEAAMLAGAVPVVPRATWTPPPMPMIEPDKEGLALMRMVRAGAKTFSEMIREQGYDPDLFLAEYSADLQRLDALGIKLDSDVRAVSQAGLTQERVGSNGGDESGSKNAA